jgi:hypothetical protein
MANVDGKWKTVINSPEGAQEGVLAVASSGDSFTGSYDQGEGAIEVKNGKVNGDDLSWKMDIIVPTPMTLDCQATVTGDSLTGAAKAGAFGDFPLTGTRE